MGLLLWRLIIQVGEVVLCDHTRKALNESSVGYGLAGGRAGEEATYRNIDAVYKFLTVTQKVPSERIILFGRSLGTGPTMDLASRVPCRAVILQSPLLSIVRTHCDCCVCCGTWSSDMFATLDKIQKIKSPVHIIHGTSTFLLLLTLPVHS